MSQRLSTNKNFLALLLNTDKVQSKALLYTLTSDQVLTLCEIAHNLVSIPLPPQTTKLILKRKGLLNKLSDKKGSWKAKRSIIENNYKQFLDLLLSTKEELESLLT